MASNINDFTLFSAFHQKWNMKNVYPVIIKQDGDWYLVYIPSTDNNTEAHSFYEAIEMARDSIATYSLGDLPMPEPCTAEEALNLTKERMDDEEFTWSDGILTYVDVDFDDYKNRLRNRSVKKNCTIPYWLAEKAEKAGVNFSRVLQDALIEKLE